MQNILRMVVAGPGHESELNDLFITKRNIIQKIKVIT